MASPGLPCYCDEPPSTRKQFIHRRLKTLIEIPDDGPSYMIAMVPLRLLLFVLTLTLLALMIYLCCLHTPELRDASAILMVGVTTAFLFFSIVHVIGHFGSTETVEYPMIFGSFIGVVCFIFIGAVIAYSGPTRSWARLISFVFCFIIGLLHAVDVLLAIGYWRHKYSNRKKYGRTVPMHTTFDANTFTQTLPPPLEACKCDVQTSITGSNIILDPYDDNPFRTYRTKKSEAASYNSYLECPVRSGFSVMAARGMQTDYSPIQREVQTTRIEVKEMPVQTASKCDLCHRHIDVEPYTPRQYVAPICDVSPARHPTVPSSPQKSIPVQTVPAYSTPSSSPTRKNLLCLCKHQSNFVPPLTPTVAPSGRHCCGSCNCSALTSTKKSTPQRQHQHQHQPHQTLHTSPQPRRVDTAGTNPNFDMNLNVGPGDNKHVKDSHRVYEARSTSSRTKPFIGRLASISGCLTTSSSSSSLHVHKNKRTQTKGQSTKKHINAEKENEVFPDVKNRNREQIDEDKFMATEMEVRSINMNSSHKVMPKHESTPKKEITVKPHEPPGDRNVILVKERRNVNEGPKMKTGVNKDTKNTAELLPIAFEPIHDSNSSKTRTKTLYREGPTKPTKIKNEVNKIPRKLEDDPINTNRKVLDEIPSPHITKENKTNIKVSPTIDNIASHKLHENTSNKVEIVEKKEKMKNAGQDEAASGTNWRYQSRNTPGSARFRPDESLKNTYESNSPEKEWTPHSHKKTATAEVKEKSGSVENEVLQQLKQNKKEPKTNKNDTGISVNDKAISSSIRLIVCPVCKKTKRPHNCIC